MQAKPDTGFIKLKRKQQLAVNRLIFNMKILALSHSLLFSKESRLREVNCIQLFISPDPTGEYLRNQIKINLIVVNWV